MGWMGRVHLLAFSAAAVLIALAPSSVEALALENGSFEEPLLASGYNLFDASSVPGWDTTSSDNKIEVWVSGFQGVDAYSGRQFAELNATENSALFQDVSGIAAGSIVGYEFAHRARGAGLDTMSLTITGLGPDNIFGTADDVTEFSRLFSSVNGV